MHLENKRALVTFTVSAIALNRVVLLNATCLLDFIMNCFGEFCFAFIFIFCIYLRNLGLFLTEAKGRE